MPYAIRKPGKLWLIVKKTTGKVVGKSTSKKKAVASIYFRMSGHSK